MRYVVEIEGASTVVRLFHSHGWRAYNEGTRRFVSVKRCSLIREARDWDTADSVKADDEEILIAIEVDNLDAQAIVPLLTDEDLACEAMYREGLKLIRECA
jgi:hypothetical protein